MAVVFKSESFLPLYFALLVALWGRRISVSFDFKMTFDGNDNPRFKVQGSFSSSYVPEAFKLLFYLGFIRTEILPVFFPNPEDLDVLVRMLQLQLTFDTLLRTVV